MVPSRHSVCLAIFRLVNSNSSVSLNVQYIALKEGLFEIKGLQVFDRATDQIYMVQDNCQIYVTS